MTRKSAEGTSLRHRSSRRGPRPVAPTTMTPEAARRLRAAMLRGETVSFERTSVPSRSVATSRGAFERLIMRPPWLPSVDPPSPLACHAGSEPPPQHSRDAVFPNGGGHFVCGGAYLGGGLAHRHCVPGPFEHRQVIVGVSEYDG